MKKLIICILLYTGSSLYSVNQTPKVVALLAFRNEENFLAQNLKALSLYTDAMVLLDDASTDNSLAIARSLKKECNIEKIITKTVWLRDEPGDRNKLLQAGREIGGTHFICIDADEMFTSNFLFNNQLKEIIVGLKPGEAIAMTWIQLWRSVNSYRFDDYIWTNQSIDIAFCDHPAFSYQSDFIHTYRIPAGCRTAKKISGYDFGLLHFQFVNWDNLLLKQAWYRCLEHIRNPKKSAQDLNYIYGRSKNEEGLRTLPSKPEWFANYPFFDASVYDKPDNWRKEQVNEWFEKYGKDYFKDLDIWDVDWTVEPKPSYLNQFVTYIFNAVTNFLNTITTSIKNLV